MLCDQPLAGSPERRVLAILVADVAGYSRLMGEDEAGTVRALKDHQAAILAMIVAFGGIVVDTAGDGVLATFPSAVRAVECGLAIQSTVGERNRDVPEEQRMRFRVGINLGDIVHEGTRVYGDGVNVAARLEGLAERGGIAISGAFYDQVNGKFDCSFEALGEQSLKNIARLGAGLSRHPSHCGTAAGRQRRLPGSGVRAIAVIALRARNRLHRPFETVLIAAIDN
jgi:adenylate cyclase